jgi:RNA polymerase sigma-70 factor (ECF subfamily)
VADEDDILQQAFIDAFRSIRDFQPRRKLAFYFWMATIADHRLLDAVKAHRTAKRGGGRDLRRSPGIAADSSVDDLIDLLAGPNRTPSQSVARHEAVQAVQVGLASLKDEYRQVIELRYVQGHTVKETAGRMQKTTAAVKNLCRRGLAELNTAVGRSADFFSKR